MFLNITVPPELAFLAETPEGLLPALPDNLVDQLRKFLTGSVNNALENADFDFSVGSTTLSGNLLGNLATIMSGIIPDGLRDSPLGAGLVDYFNSTVGVPVSACTAAS